MNIGTNANRRERGGGFESEIEQVMNRDGVMGVLEDNDGEYE